MDDFATVFAIISLVVAVIVFFRTISTNEKDLIELPLN